MFALTLLLLVLDSLLLGLRRVHAWSLVEIIESIFQKTNCLPSRNTDDTPASLTTTQLFANYRMSLNNLLKQQIKDAIAHIYDESGSAADNRYTKPEDLSKALLDILFPAEKEENTQITGVVQVPTVDTESDGSTDSKKERKKRAPMSDEAKAAMKAKRAATIAAKAATSPKSEDKPEPEAPGAPVKERKPRGPMSDEAKAAMKAKREATLAAKKAAQA
jgi:hypothetical protein